MPALHASLSSFRALGDGKKEVSLTLLGRKPLSNSPLIVDLKDELAITRRRINTLGPLLTNVVNTLRAIATPISSSLRSSNLVASPRKNILITVTSSNFGVLKANGPDADIGVGPEAQAVLADGGVPFLELVKGDAELGGDDETVVAGLDVVEGVAVVDHSGLDGKGSGDAVVALDGFNGRGLLGCSAGSGGEGTCTGRKKRCDGRELHLDGQATDIELVVCLSFGWLNELEKLSTDHRNLSALYRSSS